MAMVPVNALPLAITEADDADDADEEDMKLAQTYKLTTKSRPQHAEHLVQGEGDDDSRAHANASHEVQERIEESPRAVLEVQRVYRKPRQKVRYTCDQCQGTFLNRHHCHVCGHERCKGCARNP